MRCHVLPGRALPVVLVFALVCTIFTASAAEGAVAAASISCPQVSTTTGDVSPAPAPGVDWAGCNLVGAKIESADMTGADLAQADLYFAYFGDTDLSGTSFAGANVGYAGFSQDNLTYADLSSTSLHDAGMSIVDLAGANFSGADMSLLDAEQVTGSPVGLPPDWQIIDQTLVGPDANLDGAELQGADLSGLNLAGTMFEGANLTGANLSEADLQDANLSTILTGADISGADLTGADLYMVNSGSLKGVPASLPPHWSVVRGYLVGPYAELGDVSLVGIDLAGKDLTGAYFEDTNLTNADLQGADLARANMTDANLGGADLFGANLSHINWVGAECPNGPMTSPPSCSGARALLYDFKRFQSPHPNSHIRKSAHKLTARLRLMTNDQPLTSQISASLASGRDIRVTLRGPGIKPVSAYCNWARAGRYFQCAVTIPGNVKTGKKERYSLRPMENYGAGFVHVQGGYGPNPLYFYFS
jgi:uncharacterized protein YjbI with pentapeptide repeats